jgi:riboflavin kinase/FMN adenylyltransferase
MDKTEMDIVETTSGLAELANIKNSCVLTIGNFDGVHLGHQEILIAAGQIAAKRQTQFVVMTFEPHPLAVLHPQKRPGILTSLALKKLLLAEFGVDCLLVLESTPELLSLSPEDFVQRFIVNDIKPGVVVEGESFNFGCGRGGGIRTMQQLGDEKGFDVFVVEAKDVKLSTGQTVKVSSTMIRNMLGTGSAADAAIALGRPYRLIGQVIQGRGKGKQLGFPTANMEPVQQLIPLEGVYAGFVQIAESEEEVCAAKEKVPAVFSLGRSETLGSGTLFLVEAHMLSDNVGDLYGKWLAMDFIEYIRNQQQFETEKELAEQIARDCEKAKEILSNSRA